MDSTLYMCRMLYDSKSATVKQLQGCVCVCGHISVVEKYQANTMFFWFDK
jgi:hypothetical protein